jgi:hypothetical protein
MDEELKAAPVVYVPCLLIIIQLLIVRRKPKPLNDPCWTEEPLPISNPENENCSLVDDGTRMRPQRHQPVGSCACGWGRRMLSFLP